MSDDTLDPGAPSEAEWLPVRASLRDVAVPAQAREAALAAALAAFDEQQAAASVAAAADTAPPVSLAARRDRRVRWLTGAAAAVAVLAVGGIVLRTLDTGSGDDATVAVATERTAAADSVTAGAVPNAAAVPEAKTADVPPAPVLAATADTLAPASDATMVGAGTDATAPVPANAPVSTIGSIDAAADYGTAPSVDSPEALAAVAADLASAASTTRSAPTAVCLPDGVEMLGTVVYRQQQAIVVRAADGSISALDAFSCALIVTVAP